MAILGTDSFVLERPDLSQYSSAQIFNDFIRPQFDGLAQRFNDQAQANERDLLDVINRPSESAQDSSLPGFRDTPSAEQFISEYADMSMDQAVVAQPTQASSTVDTSQPIGARNPGDPNAKDLLSFVKGFEGFNQSAYDDYGQVSIGYGTRARKGETSISREDAESRLNEEIAMHRRRVENLNTRAGYNWTPNQLDALTSFDYNTGRLEQLTANGTRDQATIAQKLPLYNKAGGKELRGLTRRRQAETRLFLQGY